MKKITLTFFAFIVTCFLWQINAQTPPVITCDANVTQNTDAGLCTAVVNYLDATATDPDTGMPVATTLISGLPSGSAFPLGINVVTYSASDADGTSTCSLNIVITDNEDPVINCVADDTRDTDAGVCSYTVVGTEFDATFTDNCTGATITNDLNASATIAGEVLPVGVTTVDWTVDDGNGQTATCTTTITVEDNEVPVITCIADDARDTDAGICTYTVVGTEFDATFTENCAGATITNDLNASTSIAGEVLPVGTTTVNWTVDDGNGQTATCATVITVEDNEDPVVTCAADDSRDADAGGCTYTVVGTEFDATFTDNCTGATITNDLNASASIAGEVLPVGTTTVNWTVDDGNGQIATCTTLITVEDNEDPIITCVADDSRDVDAGGCSYTVVGTEFDATFTDNCTGATITNDLNASASIAGEVLPVGVTTIAWTVDDGNGQIVTCATVITVEDNEDPVITCVADDSRDTDAGVCTYTVVGTEFDATFTDNCTSATIINDLNGDVSIKGEILPVGVTTVNWTVDDGNGQTATCTTVITVEDNEVPVITCVIDDSRDTDAGVCTYTVVGTEFDATFTDNCTSATITNDLNASASIAGEILPIGVTTVNWIVDDGNGQTATCATVITVEDNEDPVITCVANDTRDTDAGGCTYTVVGTEFDATFTDNCTGATITNDLNATASIAGEVLPVGTTTVNWTVDDGNGQIVSCTTVITVEDNEDPIITCVADDTRDVDPGGCTYTIVGTEFDATFTDNCTGATITNDLNASASIAGEILSVGATTVTWTADDGNGQTVTCTTIITVEDNEDPVISCAADDTRDTDAGACSYTVVGTEFDATFTDNCTGATIANDLNATASIAGEILPIGDTTVTWTVDDGNGQIAVCTTVITVVDNILPTALCQDITVYVEATGSITIAGTDIDNGSSDNCGIASMTVTPDTFDATNVGPNTVTLTVTDVNGNVSTCTSTVTVELNTAPNLSCPTDVMMVDSDPDACGAVVHFADAVAIDLEDGSIPTVQTMGLASGSLFPVGDTIIEFSATDSVGITVTCQFTITVEDNIAPELTCPLDQTVDPGAGVLLYEVPDYFAIGEAIAEDNCTDPVVITIQDPVAGTLLPDGVHTVTIMAQDEYGNISTCTFQLTVDTTLGVNDIALDTAINMYPNPAKNNVTFANSSNIQLEKAVIYDISGRLIDTFNLSNMQGEKIVDISGLSSGVYLVQITGEGSSAIKKLIKD